MSPGRVQRIHSRNASFQQWHSLLGNRTKRNRHREFLVQGVRPLTLALEHDWPVRALLRGDGDLSNWAQGVWEETAAESHGILAPELMAELGGKDEATPELLAVLELPPDDLDRVRAAERVPLVTVFDRPSSPGNIGTLVRSADAFGASGVVVAGHAADPYDPRCVRASTGSMLSVPVVRVPSHTEVLDWVQQQGTQGGAWTVVGLDEGGDLPLRAVDLTGPTVLVVGNETRGLTRAWREACDHIVSIPMVGDASSLNAGVAGSIVLHEALRQRLG
ncbi:rRNA methyltransferase [Ornithinimicrobium faecis]|uniref:rRNA methyltransferase n=1 Tax=Ornithinimicrobium faecis TaxID=2934158 RepID=A0ABY4YRN6_9MICO|nr:TrmH family RNA methyltransferase [Ornithinimicrobium sp. HY1793]USQ79436.1 rRNA methyltransferase [Ornithinimicrobium sp. HY1793]